MMQPNFSTRFSTQLLKTSPGTEFSSRALRLELVSYLAIIFRLPLGRKMHARDNDGLDCSRNCARSVVIASSPAFLRDSDCNCSDWRLRSERSDQSSATFRDGRERLSRRLYARGDLLRSVDIWRAISTIGPSRPIGGHRIGIGSAQYGRR